MKLQIFANYGVLAHEKQIIYTFGNPNETATCYDHIFVNLPADWELFKTESGHPMVTSPWKWNYEINEVLTSVGDEPAFSARRSDGTWYKATLKKSFPVEYSSGESRENPGTGVDYMLATVPGPDDEDIELYAEARLEDYGWTPDDNDSHYCANYDETATYDDLKQMILDQAEENGIDPDLLVFYMDDFV